jgi:hypothetical protein
MDNSTVMLQIVASFTDDSRGVIYNRNMFIVQATEWLGKSVLGRSRCACWLQSLD